MNRISDLHQFGQSIWYDNIQRRLLEDGTLASLINQEDILGMTSNPTIFNNAIGKTNDYDSALKPLSWAGYKPEQIFFQLAVEDITTATDLFKVQYEKSNHLNGYVSLEVSPNFANNTNKTFSEAKRLWKWVNRPNLMIKIPATQEGIPAIRKAIAEGINVNVTLIFSLSRYKEVINAYIEGIEDRVRLGKPVDNIASVASFFISRFDSKIDPMLQKMVDAKNRDSALAKSLLGKAAIANANLAYELFEKEFSSERFQKLKKAGARVQRPLWASTSTKNPEYRDVIYIEDLIAPDTVNTVPANTLDAFRDHGTSKVTITAQSINGSHKILSDLQSLGISVEKVSEILEEEGVSSFSAAYAEMLGTIKNRSKQFKKEIFSLVDPIQSNVQRLEENNFVQRLFDKDPTLWSSDDDAQAEIINRLGWLWAPQNGLSQVESLIQFRDECLKSGYKKALLIGMGGSSLAPEVISLVLGSDIASQKKDGLELIIIDSTDPIQLKSTLKWVDFSTTLFIVSSKSGSTSEINALFNIFWQKAKKKLGKNTASHFIAITDPGSSLEKKGLDLKFRKVFLADSSVGGRFSALISFGLVPAALMGLDLNLFLQRAQLMADQCQPAVPYGRNPGLVIGSILGQAANAGIDKFTIIADPAINSIGSWMEQLIAESSGKNGKGIVPIDIEPMIKPQKYQKDRIFVYMRLDGTLDDYVHKLVRAKIPVIIQNWNDKYDLSGQFYVWEYATAVACSVMGINAFNQPAVQDNKTRTANKVVDFQKSGKLQEGDYSLSLGDVHLYGKQFPGLKEITDLSQIIPAFLSQLKDGDYVAINAYLPRNEKVLKMLQSFRKKILNYYGKATTLGFGPRFLHSTGQLHKGGPDNGVFIQITCDYKQDYPIPEQGLNIGILERAQALGDFESLVARNRRVIRINLSDISQLKKL